jgi:DNA-binding NtrC family response regulator
MIRIAVVEDDPVLSASIVQRLRLEGYDAVAYDTGAAALAGLTRAIPSLILCDIRLPDLDGETVMRRALGDIGAVPVIFMTAYGDFEQAVRLVRDGARDYIPKPFDLDELMERIASWTAAARGAEAPADEELPFRGNSPAVAAVRDLLVRAARVDTPVLLTGETGTGKEVAARFLARAGRGRDRPFVAVNAATLTPELAASQLFGHERGAFTGAHTRAVGALESAGDGTLFLDEVGELPAEVQGQLLRALEDRRFTRVGGTATIPFRGRFVFATNRDLPAEVRSGRFREDLYYRIGVIECRLPPLRERLDELEALVTDLVDEIAPRLGRTPAKVAPDALARARTWRWPGNVRELRNRVERALALSEGPVLTTSDLFPDDPTAPARVEEPGTGGVAPPAGERLADARAAAEAAHIRRILSETDRNIQLTARRLGISRTTLWEKMRTYGL